MGSWDASLCVRHMFLSCLSGGRPGWLKRIFWRVQPLAYIYSSCSAAAQRRRWTESTCLARAAAAHYFGRFSRLLFLSDEIPLRFIVRARPEPRVSTGRGKRNKRTHVCTTCSPLFIGPWLLLTEVEAVECLRFFIGRAMPCPSCSPPDMHAAGVYVRRTIDSRQWLEQSPGMPSVVF